MKRAGMRGVLVIVIAAALAGGVLTGCEDFWDALLSGPWTVSGQAVDFFSAQLAGIEGVNVTLRYENDESIVHSAATNANGDFSVTYNHIGKYTMSAAKDGWHFVPLSVYLDRVIVALPVIPGVFLGASLMSVNGAVVDSRDADLAGVEGVGVTLTKKDDPTVVYTATTGADGAFAVAYEVEGEFTMSAQKDGWFFIPQTVFIGGWLQTLPSILGVAADSDPALADSALAFILVWNSVYTDVDGHITFAEGDGSGNSVAGIVPQTSFAHPNQDWTTVPYVGFGPDTATDREHVRPTFQDDSANTVGAVLLTDDDRPAVQIDRDDWDGSGPEVMTVRTIPYWPAAQTMGIAPDGAGVGNYLPETGPNGGAMTYGWIGVMQYYVDGWHSSVEGGGRESDGGSSLISNTDGTGADAVLYVVQGANLLGEFSVPKYANLRTAAVVRVNIFIAEETDNTDYVTYFQIVPDIRSTTYADIKSLGGVGPTGFFAPGRSR